MPMRPVRVPERVRPVLLVLVLAPVTAEYLIGYDDTLTNVPALVFGVVFFGPLYGAPAVLIRELTRRAGRGWPTILLLACGFGLIEAGLIDQSLFDPAYRDIAFWPSLREPTFLAPLGTSAFMLVSFVGGHVLGSVAAPIALAEGCWPQQRDRPWLRWPGCAVLLGLWALAGLFVLQDQLASTSFRITPGRAAWTVAAVGVLAALALGRPRPGRSVRAESGAGRLAPPAWVVVLVTAGLLTPRSLVPGSWPGTVLAMAGIGLWLVLMARWSRRTGWSGGHVAAAVAGDVLSIGGPAFFITPLGHQNPVAKLVANTVLLGGVLLVARTAARRTACAEAGASGVRPGPPLDPSRGRSVGSPRL